MNDGTGEGWDTLEWVAPEAPNLYKYTGLKRLRYCYLRYAIKDAFDNALLNIRLNGMDSRLPDTRIAYFHDEEVKQQEDI